jgi:hypothetical protein
VRTGRHCCHRGRARWHTVVLRTRPSAIVAAVARSHEASVGSVDMLGIVDAAEEMNRPGDDELRPAGSLAGEHGEVGTLDCVVADPERFSMVLSDAVTSGLNSDRSRDLWREAVGRRYARKPVGRIAQLARALPLQGRCRGFESLCAHHHDDSVRGRRRSAFHSRGLRCKSVPVLVAMSIGTLPREQAVGKCSVLLPGAERQAQLVVGA